MNSLVFRRMLPYFAITITLLAVFVILGNITAQRVGDGAEYYALFYAWADTRRPWMTAASFASYESFFNQGNVSDLVPREWLENEFPSLRLGGTADFNHFWFYSFLAFVLSKLLGVVGGPNGPHESFLALHFLLLLEAALASFYFFKWRGLAAFLIMTVTSPMLWYFDKVHTELFTYCAVFVAILLILRKNYLGSSFALAIVSTQNPSFALVAFLPFAYRLVALRKTYFSFIEVVLAIATTLLVIAHPLYYFLRYGVPTPQLLAGGASLGENLSIFYIWIIDPDLGLLPNWLIGLLFLLAALRIFIFDKKNRGFVEDRFFLIFIILFFMINFFAHSSTTNLNSAATPGVARYSLWYLPAFFPIVYYVLSNPPRRKWLVILFGIVLTVAAVFNLTQSNPIKHEDSSTPTRLSSLIQTHASYLYNPPAEVFAERYSGVGEAVHNLKLRGILGPDCKKVLIFSGENRSNIITPKNCFVDSSKLENYINAFNHYMSDQEAFYVHLDEKAIKHASLILGRGEMSIGLGMIGNNVLKSGWSAPEDWGVWSNGRRAKISFPCNENQFYFGQEKIMVHLKLHPFVKQKIEVENNDSVVYKGTLEGLSDINFSGAVNGCKKNSIDFTMKISNPKSPFELGQSTDRRSLGVGLTKIIIDTEK